MVRFLSSRLACVGLLVAMVGVVGCTPSASKKSARQPSTTAKQAEKGPAAERKTPMAAPQPTTVAEDQPALDETSDPVAPMDTAEGPAAALQPAIDPVPAIDLTPAIDPRATDTPPTEAGHAVHAPDLPDLPDLPELGNPADTVQPAEPEPPKSPLGPPLVDNSEAMTRLDPAKSLWFDPKGKRVVFIGRICQTDAPLEMFACLANTKEHEAVVAVDVEAFKVHTALLAVGAEVGGPVQFTPEYRPARGTEIEISVAWNDADGKRRTARAQDWILDMSTGKPMAHAWVFAGSGFWGDETGQRRYYAENGDFICVSNFSTAMLDLPIQSTDKDEALLFHANRTRIPPIDTPVTVVLTPKLPAEKATPSEPAEQEAAEPRPAEEKPAVEPPADKDVPGEGPAKEGAESASREATPAIAESPDSPEAQPADLGPPLVKDPKELTRLDRDRPLWFDRKDKQIVMVGQVCQRNAPLEMFVCLKDTKEHEAVVCVDVKAASVHAGLLALGAQAGHPVRFQPQYQPAEGTEIDVIVAWKDAQGKQQTAPAQQWILDVQTGKPMSHPFVFGGSGFWRDEETGRRHYMAESGDFICVSNFTTAMLDIPVHSSQANEALMFQAFEQKIPPLGTPVTLLLKPKLPPAKPPADAEQPAERSPESPPKDPPAESPSPADGQR